MNFYHVSMVPKQLLLLSLACQSFAYNGKRSFYAFSEVVLKMPEELEVTMLLPSQFSPIAGHVRILCSERVIQCHSALMVATHHVWIKLQANQSQT